MSDDERSAPGGLTEQRAHEFRTFGFLVFRRFFSPADMQRLCKEFQEAHDSAYVRRPFDGKAPHWALLGPPGSAFAELLEDPRLCGMAEQLYGEDVIGAFCDGYRFVGDTIWHADTVGFEHYGMKFSFYLQPLHRDSGALRVIPGSHRQPFHADLGKLMNESHPKIADVPSVPIETEPGDVIAYDLRLWHASHDGFPDRRSAGLHYFHNPKTAVEREAFHAQDVLMRTHFRDLRRAQDGAAAAELALARNPVITDAWLAAVAGASGRRASWLQRLRENGYLERVALSEAERDWLPHRYG